MKMFLCVLLIACVGCVHKVTAKATIPLAPDIRPSTLIVHVDKEEGPRAEDEGTLMNLLRQDFLNMDLSRGIVDYKLRFAMDVIMRRLLITHMENEP